MKYDAHINVEYVGSVKSIKYVFKYIFKGKDKECVVIRDGENVVVDCDEIKSYQDMRYLSSMEAAWRIQQYPLHSRSYWVIRFPVHLEGQQNIIFEEEDEINEDNINEYNKDSMLMGWFKLNEENHEETENMLYSEIPKNFTWDKKERKWKRRRRGVNKIVVRLSHVCFRDFKRFCFICYLE